MKKLNYEFIGKALWFPVEKVLVIADLHIGYEEVLNRMGIFVPRNQFDEIISDLDKIFAKIGKAKEVIICGDLKHNFGSILEQEWGETLKLIDYLGERCGKIVLVKGNHDKILEPIARRRGILFVESYIKEVGGKKTAFIHGSFLLGKETKPCELKDVKRIVMGHKHPAVMISDKYKQEKYKCFLVGKWKGNEVIILPSFFPLIEGSSSEDSDSENFLFIPDRELEKFDVYAIGEEVYKFGKLRDIKRLD